MARLFDDGATENLAVGSAIISDYPFAMCCWYNTDDASVSQALMWVGDKDVTNYYSVFYLNTTGDVISVFTHNYGGGDTRTASTSTSYTANTWEHAGLIYLSTSERHVYHNGGGKGSNNDGLSAMANHDQVGIGANLNSVPSGYTSGHIAEAAIWDLTDWGVNDAAREIAFEKAIASMAKGFSPLFFPLGLLGYWPLVRGLNDSVGGFNMTASGTVVSAHPRIIYPSGIWVPHKTEAVGVTVPVMIHHYKQAGGL